MIRVNLLPEDRRPVERTPLPRLLIIFFGVFLVGVEVVGLIYYYSLAIPSAEAYLQNIESNIPNYKAQAMQVDEMRQKIQALQVRRQAVVELWGDRRKWAPIFERLRDVIPENVWIRNFKIKSGRDGVHTVIALDASASGQTTKKMGEEVTNFIRAIEGDGQLRKQLIVGEAVDLGEQSRRVLPGSEDDKRLPHAVMDFSLSINLNAPGTANKEAEE